jgi:hypothetical protein
MATPTHGEYDAVQDLLNAESLGKEVAAVLSLEKDVCGRDHEHEGSPRSVLLRLGSSLTTLNGLVCYLFERRYGWSEVADGQKADMDSSSTGKQQGPRVCDHNRVLLPYTTPPVLLRGGETIHCSEEEKKAINRAIDNLLRDLTSAPLPRAAAAANGTDDDDALSLVQALEAVAMHTQRPVVRRETIFYFFDWLDTQIKSTNATANLERVLLDSQEVETR